jgi:hypothetical protein
MEVPRPDLWKYSSCLRAMKHSLGLEQRRMGPCKTLSAMICRSSFLALPIR